MPGGPDPLSARPNTLPAGANQLSARDH